MTVSIGKGAAKSGSLKRSLGLWAIVALGLGYMTPTVVFDTFGIVAQQTESVVPTAYLLALIVMLFTAISYGKMAGAMPSAGSAYTYARESIHPNVGFIVGWTSLIDYVLLPLVNALIIRSYLEQIFPNVWPWTWVIIYCAAVTTIIYMTMRGTSNVNMILLIFSVLVMALFLVLLIVLHAREGAMVTDTTPANTVGPLAPFWHDGVALGPVLMGATVVCFSFIGFDAVTMYVEEAKHPRIVPRAILLAVLIGGAIFIIPAYFTQLHFPDWHVFGDDALNNSALVQLGNEIGGNWLRNVLTAAGFCATVASGLASHASVSRMLLVMGRNNVLPKRFFGFINPRTHTPTYNIVLVGIICLAAGAFNLDLIASFINFGALTAFTFVNISVIAWFAIRKNRRHTPGDIVKFIVLPTIGMIMTGILWANLHGTALYGGLIWAALGLVYLLWLTRGFHRQVAGFDESQEVADLAE